MSKLILLILLFSFYGCVQHADFPAIIVSQNLETQYDAARLEFYRFNGSGVCDCKGVYLADDSSKDTILLLESGVRFVELQEKGDTIEYLFVSDWNGKEVKSLIEQHLAPCSNGLKVAFMKGQANPIYVDVDRVRFFYGADEREVIESGYDHFLECVRKNTKANAWLRRRVEVMYADSIIPATK